MATNKKTVQQGANDADHRKRMAALRDVLDRTFGELASGAPELWEDKTYLLLVGIVYEQLAFSTEEVATGDLVSLAKVLVDLRKSDPAGRPVVVSRKKRVSKKKALPKAIAGTVREVYGVAPRAANAEIVTKC